MEDFIQSPFCKPALAAGPLGMTEETMSRFPEAVPRFFSSLTFQFNGSVLGFYLIAKDHLEFSW